MFSKMIQALILSGGLLVAGAASANERSVVVPVIAGAAVGAVIATLASNAGDGHRDRPPQRSYQPHYRLQPHYQPRYYQQRHRPVVYVPVAPRVQYRRLAPPPRFHDGGHDRRYDHSVGHRPGDGRR